MNIVEVLSKNDLEGIKTAEKEQVVDGDLFACLISQFFPSDQPEKSSKGQYPEEILNILTGQNKEGKGISAEEMSILSDQFSGLDGLTADKDVLTVDKDALTAELKNLLDSLNNNEANHNEILLQSTYAQILQGLIPAGKEANSGQNGFDFQTEAMKQKEISIANSNQLGDAKTVKHSVLKSIPSGITRMAVPEAQTQESAALTRTELAYYIKTNHYLNELSGEITKTASSNSNTNNSTNTNSQYFSGINTWNPFTAHLTRQQATGKSVQQVRPGVEPITVPGENTKTDINGLNLTSLNSLQKVVTEAQADAAATANRFKANESEPQVISDSNKSGNSVLSEGSKGEQIESLLTQAAVGKQTDSIQPLQRTLQALADASKIWNQVVNALKQKELQNNREVKEMSLKLHPAELGKLQVSLRMEDGQLHLQIQASEQATASYLQNHMQELRHNLTQLGISCGSLEMGFDGQEQQQDRNTEENTGSHLTNNEEETQEFSSYINYSNLFGEKTTINVSA